MLMKALDLVYDKAVKGIPGTAGIPGMGSVEDFAQSYMEGDKSLEEKVDSLIRFQVAKASTAGFVTGLGGILTLPVTLPTNLASVFYIQLQMAAAIAYMSGYDVRDDRVKTFCYVCLCGESATKVLRGAGITIGKKITEQMIKRLSFESIKRINRAVGFRLITKFGQTGVVNFGKAIPVVGGVVGGTFDGATTYAVGKAAKRTFIEVPENRAAPSPEPSTDFPTKDVSSSTLDISNVGEFIRDELAGVEDMLFGRNESDEDHRKSWLD